MTQHENTHNGVVPPLFAVAVQADIAASPLEVFSTATARPGAWLWPMPAATEVGEVNGMGAVVTDFEPGVKYRNHMEGPDGWFNTLTFDISEHSGGARLDYLHEGKFPADYDLQLDACTKHTDLYVHTLGAAAEFFPGQDVTYVTLDAPASSSAHGLEKLLAALNISDAAIGNRIHSSAGADATSGTATAQLHGEIDFATEHFFGVRSENAMFRVFDRGAWGGPVTVVWHVFHSEGFDAPAAAARIEASWSTFLTDVFQ